MASASATAHGQSPGAGNAGISISFHTKATQIPVQSRFFLFYFDLPLTFQRTRGWELFVESSLQAVLSSAPQLPEGASSLVSSASFSGSLRGCCWLRLQLQGTPRGPRATQVRLTKAGSRSLTTTYSFLLPCKGKVPHPLETVGSPGSLMLSNVLLSSKSS